MPSPEKLKRIYELCAEHDLDYFGKEWDRQTIEYMLCAEFPDEEEDREEQEPWEKNGPSMWCSWEDDPHGPWPTPNAGYWLAGVATFFLIILVILIIIIKL